MNENEFFDLILNALNVVNGINVGKVAKTVNNDIVVGTRLGIVEIRKEGEKLVVKYPESSFFKLFGNKVTEKLITQLTGYYYRNNENVVLLFDNIGNQLEIIAGEMKINANVKSLNL